MRADYINIGGREYRVEVNWNAIVAYMESSGRDTLQALQDFAHLKPSDIAGLMAAAINEGEAIEGRESSLSAKDIGRMNDMMNAVPQFLDIFIRQMSPTMGENEDEKKKE